MAAWKGAAAPSSSAARPCPARSPPHTPAEYKVVQREQIANPAPLGLFAFGEPCCTRWQHCSHWTTAPAARDHSATSPAT